MRNQEFKGNITHATIDTPKLEEMRFVRAICIADLHGYTNNEEKAKRLAKAIKDKAPDYIFIAGDIFHNASAWDGGERLKRFKKFIEILSEAAPVFITWGNHDLRGMTSNNKDTRIRNLMALEDVRKGMVYPLYNDSVVVDNMEIVGFVPSFELMEGSKLEGLPIQIHGIAHDRFIEEYEASGARFTHPELIATFLGHDPHLIAASENGIGLESLSQCDFFVTGHLHDGYRPVLKAIGLGNLSSFQYDCGWVEQPTLVDKDGNKISKPFWPPFYGKTNLCRGIVYFDDDAQQKVWQSPEGNFYVNLAEQPNEQIWVAILEDSARRIINENGLHAMLISEGINPGFFRQESLSTINTIDFQGTSRVLKR